MRLAVIGLSLLGLSTIQFLVVAIFLRPKRVRRAGFSSGGEMRWTTHAGHTWEQRLFQVAVIESILGTAIMMEVFFHPIASLVNEIAWRQYYWG